MTGRILICFVISILVFSCANDTTVDTGYKIKKDTTKKSEHIGKDVLSGIEMIKVVEKFNTIFTISFGDTIVFCTTKGKVEIADTLDHIRKPFVDLKVKFMLDKIYVLPLSKTKWFFVWQESSMDGIETDLAVFDQGNPDPEWKIRFTDPDPGIPVVDGNVAYVSTLGRAAKISMSEGRVLWTKDGLYDQYKAAFRKIDKPIVFPDKVIFVDFPIPGRRDYRDSLILDPITGERKK